MTERPVFDNISMIGRISYLFMCIERYLVNRYPDRDWSPVADRLWNWTEEYWDEARDKSDQIIPEYVFEFNSYEKVNNRCFDGEMSEDLYNQLLQLYAGITSGDSEDEINQVLFTTVEWGTYCDGTAFQNAVGPTLALIDFLLEILNKYGIDYPNTDGLQQITMEQKNEWGEFCNCRNLSIIL